MRIAIGYVRVSTQQELQQDSVAFQEKILKARAEQQGYTWVHTFKDIGKTGTKLKGRDDFQAMLDFVKEHQDDAVKIYCTQVSRFARNVLDGLLIAKELREMGIGLYFDDIALDTASDNFESEFQQELLAAEKHSAQLSRRIKMSKSIAKSAGQNSGNFKSYGFNYLTKKESNLSESERISLNDEEVILIKRMVQLYLYEDNGTHVTSRILNEEGFRKKNGTLWTSSDVANVLQNEKLCGAIWTRKSYRQNYKDDRKIILDLISQDTSKISEVLSHGEQVKFIRNHHVAIITEEEYKNILKKMNESRAIKSKMPVNKGKHLFSNYLLCGICGKNYVFKSLKYDNYTCITKTKFGKKSCNSISVKEDDIKKAFVEMYNKLITEKDKLSFASEKLGMMIEQRNEDFTNIKIVAEQIEQIDALTEQITNNVLLSHKTVTDDYAKELLDDNYELYKQYAPTKQIPHFMYEEDRIAYLEEQEKHSINKEIEEINLREIQMMNLHFSQARESLEKALHQMQRNKEYKETLKMNGCDLRGTKKVVDFLLEDAQPIKEFDEELFKKMVYKIKIGDNREILHNNDLEDSFFDEDLTFILKWNEKEKREDFF